MDPGPPSQETLLEAVRSRAATDDALDLLRAGAELAAELTEAGEELITVLVTSARQSGASWSDIGARLGVTRQGAHQRFAPKEEGRFAMFTRFAPASRQVLDRARSEAEQIGHGFLGTEHVLAALAGSSSPASRVLDGLGLTPEAVRARIVEVVGAGTGARSDCQSLTPRTKRMLECSFRACRALGARAIEPEHLLLGLVYEGEGVGARILRDAGGTAERVAGDLGGILGTEVPAELPRGRGPLTIDFSRLLRFGR